MPATKPTYEDVMAECQALARQVPGYCKLEEMGKSFEGRPIPLLTLTDPAVPLAEKSVAFFTGGTHGAEEVGRAASLALARWLLSAEGSQHLRTQVVLICPCLSPDGAIRNSYHNAQDINIYMAYPLGTEPTTPEARAAYAVAQQWIPDCYADVHGLAGGAIGDSQYVPQGRNSGLFLMSLAISHEMDAAAEALGYPQRFCHIILQRKGEQHQDSLFLRLMAEDNALTYTVETTENYYPLEDSIRSALARLSTLVKVGDRAGWYQPYRGYPCDLLAGSPVGALMTYGSDYQQRRVNRRKTSRAILDGSIYSVARLAGDVGHVATVRIQLEKEIADPPEGVVLQLRLDPRVRIKRVTFQGSELQSCRTDGYQVDSGPNYLGVRTALRRSLTIGNNDLCVEYDAPYVAHAD
jgi:hypothetical protein